MTMNLNNAGVGQPNKRSIKLNEFIAHGSAVTACTLGHKSSCLAATGGDDKKVNLWTLNKSACIMSLNGHTSSIHSISFSSNEDKIVSGSASGSVKVWDLECNKQICNLVGHKTSVTCIEYHNYADYIASGSIDSQIRLWDLRKKGCIFTYKGHTNCINALRFSPDSKWIASASDDSLVKIWDLKAGRLLIDLKSHQCAVNSIEFHPNEFLLATGSTDRTVKFWDLEKMENVSTSPALLSSVKMVKFETNGRCLFSALHDNLQSISWEPSEIHDSVYCQWKNISDMCISSNKLIASSFTNNMVSFFAVDLLQVAPIGSPPHNEDRHQFLPNIVNKPVNVTNNNRKSFRHFDKFEASEQPQEDFVPTNEIDNFKADIFNQEEYNRIFKPKREIIRQIASFHEANGSNNNNEPKRSALNRFCKENSPGENQNFFIDIKTNQPPPQQAQPVVQPIPNLRQTSVPLSPNFNSDNIKQNLFNEVNVPVNRQSIKEDPVQPVRMSIKEKPSDVIKSEEVKLAEELKDKINMEPKKSFQVDKNNEENVNLAIEIEMGHDNFMKEMKMRSRKLQSICFMWNSGNIRSALDHAVNLNDVKIMADILNEINSLGNLWNLDVSTILLPSIRNLIDSRYEEHMLIGSESCKLILKNFGKLIKSNIMSVANVGVGVDISREERQSKCRACYHNFLEILNIIEKKMQMVQSAKLINNFREINLLMKTIE